MEARRLSGGGSNPALLKALPAVDRAALGGLEGHRRFLAALRAGCRGLDARIPLPVHHLTTFGFAGFTSLRFVLEALIGKEQLFSCRKYEICSAIAALEDPIPVLHGSSPSEQGLVRTDAAR